MINPSLINTEIKNIQDKIYYIKNNAKYLQHTERHNVFYFWLTGVMSVPSILGICSKPNGWLPDEHLLSPKQAEDFYSQSFLVPLLGFYTGVLALTYFKATKNVRLLMEDCDKVMETLASGNMTHEMKEHIKDYIDRAVTFIDEKKERENNRNTFQRPLMYSALAGIVNYAKNPTAVMMTGVATVCLETAEAIKEFSVSRKPF